MSTTAGVAVLLDGQDRHGGEQEADVDQRIRPVGGEDASLPSSDPPRAAAQRHQTVLGQMGQPVNRVDAEYRERDEAPAGHAGHAGQHQPRRQPGQQVRETPAEQDDQRNHEQGVEHHVAEIEQVPAGEQTAALRGADLLEDADGQHEAEHHGPGQLKTAGYGGTAHPACP